MSVLFMDDAQDIARIVDLVTSEREKSLSVREWKFRLAGYGYAVRDTEDGQIVESLTRKTAICTLPSAAHA